MLKILNITGIPRGAKGLIKRLCVKRSVLKYILWSEQGLHASALSDTEERRDFAV